LDPRRRRDRDTYGYEPLPKDLFERELRLLRERVRFFAMKRTRSQFILEMALAAFSLGVLGVALYYVFNG